MDARPNGMFASMLALAFLLVDSLLMSALGGQEALAQPSQSEPLALLIPFGVTDVSDAKTSAAATSKAAASLKHGRTVEIAKAGIGLLVWDLNREPEGSRLRIGPTANAAGLNVTVEGIF